jgi:hypothetical protein
MPEKHRVADSLPNQIKRQIRNGVFLRLNPRKGLKSMNNRLKAFAILPIAASLTFFGLQVVTSSVAATSSGSTPTDASTGATAATIEDCDWYLDGVEGEIALVAEDAMEYVGDDYTLSADNDGIEVYFSGTETEDERCSFYDDVMGAAVEVSWTTAAFTSTTDDSLDWDLGDALETSGVSSLDVTYSTPVGSSCDAAFTAGAVASITDPSASPIAPATITNTATGSFNPSALSGATFAKCSLAANYSVVLPGGRTPTSPGSSYVFTGPRLITTIVVNDPEE